MKAESLLMAILVAITFTSCNQGVKDVADPENPATIYINSDIITMEGDEPQYVEALVEEKGKIVFVGSLADAEVKYENARKRDLDGKTLVPGFIDGHAHFAAIGAQAITANLLAAPDGNCNSIDDLVAELKRWYEKNGTDKTQGWIIGMGFRLLAVRLKCN